MNATLRAGPVVPDFAVVRRRAIFQCCKWDPQVGDVSALCPFPILLRHADWQQLSGWAERLARETAEAEVELLARPELHGRLGLSRPLRKLFRRGEPSRGAARVMRFDFHQTAAGWRISEANTDVPGGFIEAGGFTALMAERYPSWRSAGDPAVAYTAAIGRHLRAGGMIALAHATSYVDDRQVMEYLARLLHQAGHPVGLVSPEYLRWHDGHCFLQSSSQPVHFIVRFFPSEWLSSLPAVCAWQHFFRSGRTPISNPGSAILTQSKRFPLVWDQLASPLTAWRELLPRTWDPHRRADDAPDWVLKPALGRVGEDIGLPGVTPAREWQAIRRAARRHPRDWVAQDQFESIPVDTEFGLVHACLGVYTVDGEACGIYGRLARRPLIDHSAWDAAVLVEEKENGEEAKVTAA